MVKKLTRTGRWKLPPVHWQHLAFHVSPSLKALCKIASMLVEQFTRTRRGVLIWLGGSLHEGYNCHQKYLFTAPIPFTCKKKRLNDSNTTPTNFDGHVPIKVELFLLLEHQVQLPWPHNKMQKFQKCLVCPFQRPYTHLAHHALSMITLVALLLWNSYVEHQCTYSTQYFFVFPTFIHPKLWLLTNHLLIASSIDECLGLNYCSNDTSEAPLTNSFICRNNSRSILELNHDK